jgi:hypothetical protein
MSDRWSRLAPLTAVFFTGLLVASVALSWNTPNSDASGAKVISFFHSHRSEEMASNFLGGAAAAFLLFFASALRVHLRRGADGLAALGFGGGILAAGGGAIFSSLGLALADVPTKLDASSAQALNVLSNDFFFPFAVGLSAFMIGNGLAIVRGRALPRWLGWVAFVIGLVSFSPVGFFAFFAVMVWAVIVGVLLYVRGGQPTGSPHPDSPSAAS